MKNVPKLFATYIVVPNYPKTIGKPYFKRVEELLGELDQENHDNGKWRLRYQGQEMTGKLSDII